MKRSILLTLALTLIPSLTHAFTLRSGEKLYVSVPFKDDLYIAAGTITIKEDIEGDVTVAGGEVSVQHNISEDLNIVGGRVEVTGNVGDDLRIAGGDVRIDGTVADDLIVLGGGVHLTEGATIAGDVVIKGGDITIDGEVKGKTQILGGTVVVNAPLKGEADIRAVDLTLNAIILGNATIAAEKLTVGEKARFGSDLRYWLRGGERDFSPTILRGNAAFDPSLSGPAPVPSGLAGMFFAALNIFSLLSATLLILILTLVTRTFFKATAKTLEQRPVRCALIGLLYFILTPVLGFLLIVSIVGFPLGLLLLTLYLFSVLFAKALTAVVLAKWMEIRNRKDWGVAALTLVSLGIFVLLKFLSAIPLLGWLALLAAICGCFGAMLEVKWERMKKVL